MAGNTEDIIYVCICSKYQPSSPHERCRKVYKPTITDRGIKYACGCLRSDADIEGLKQIEDVFLPMEIGCLIVRQSYPEDIKAYGC